MAFLMMRVILKKKILQWKNCVPGIRAADCRSNAFFNTSGLAYKSLGLKDKLSAMSEEEQLALLATDGMLVKRPLLVDENFVLVGFKPAEWQEILCK